LKTGTNPIPDPNRPTTWDPDPNFNPNRPTGKNYLKTDTNPYS